MSEETPTPENQNLALYWRAYQDVLHPAIEKELALDGAESAPLLEAVSSVCETSFYIGAEAVVAALLHAQRTQGPDVAEAFDALARQCEAYLAQFHHTPNPNGGADG